MARTFAMFFGCTTVLLGAVVAWLVYPHFLTASAASGREGDIVFPDKVFIGTKAYVAAKGTMTADWVGYKNNTYSILCVLTSAS